jgi:hypothetical protein
VGFCECGFKILRSKLLMVGKIFSSILAGSLSMWLIMLAKFQADFLKATEP